jgi:hypothetical protein
MNTKRIGNITEMEVMLAFVKQGYNVLIPYGDCERYDFVADVNGKFLRVQVKTARLEDEGAKIVFNTDSTHRANGKVIHHSYTKDDIDYFATSYDGIIYLVPVEETTTREKSLRLLPTRNGQTKGIYFAKDYVMEEVIKNWS